MTTEQEYPEEVSCFICLKSIIDYKIVILYIKCKDMDIGTSVAVCDEDLNWIKNNPDAGTAICQSRLNAIMEREDNNL